MAKYLAKDANSEAIDIFKNLQFVVRVEGEAEAIIHKSNLSYEKYSPSQVPRVFCKLIFVML